MQDFASTALYDLIVRELARRGYRADASGVYAGKVETIRKRALLAGALEALGPGAIVAIGQSVRQVGFDPSLAVLRRSTSAADFVDRWQRFERYYHGRHRVRVLEQSVSSLVLEHYAVEGPAPSLGEDLLVCGMIAALLGEIGCAGVCVDVGASRQAVIRDGNALDLMYLQCGSAARWQLHWKSQAGRPAREPVAVEDPSRLSTRIRALLAHDLGRSWRLPVLARHLDASPRSLQRALANEGQSFQKIVRRVRAEGAARLLLEGESQLGEIGYACGFADQAHFSREFKIRFNLQPEVFRRLLAQRA